MARKARPWTCRRTKCKFKNPVRTRKCQKCGAPRPARRRPAHMSALDMSYEDYIVLNGGEFCWICGAKRSVKRRLHRDHCHNTHVARGLLCYKCNTALPNWVTSEWLRRAAEYVGRYE